MKKLQKNWQAILFDFDGVIAASHEVKCAAFAALFSAFAMISRMSIRFLPP